MKRTLEQDAVSRAVRSSGYCRSEVARMPISADTRHRSGVTSHADLGAAQRRHRATPRSSVTSRLSSRSYSSSSVGLITGSVLHILGADTPADFVWAGAAVVVLGPLVWSVARSLVRRDVGVDAIALLAIAAALVLGEYLTAVIVSLMLAGGNALEASANARARRELRLLVERAPANRAPASWRARRRGHGRRARARRRGRRPRR